MAFFNFQITEADIGRALDPINGFLVDLSLLVPPIHEREAWHPIKQIYTRGWFCLRGDADNRPRALRNLISYNAAANPLGAWGDIWRDASVHYRGRLLVESVPRGSEWQLRLSDIANVRAAAA